MLYFILLFLFFFLASLFLPPWFRFQRDEDSDFFLLPLFPFAFFFLFLYYSSQPSTKRDGFMWNFCALVLVFLLFYFIFSVNFCPTLQCFKTPGSFPEVGSVQH